MSSKLIQDRQAASDAVIEQVSEHLPAAREALTTVLSPYLYPGETLPDVGLLVQLVARRLARLREHMVMADDAHEEELSDDEAPREVRDDTSADLWALLQETRELLKGVFGASALPSLGFKGSIPEDPEDLAPFSRKVVAALRSGNLPPPRVPSVVVNPAALVAPLADDLETLERALDDVDREEREAEVTLRDKQAALDRYDMGFSQCASFLVGLFTLAGDDELAQRLRPSARRPGRLSEAHDPHTSES